MCWQRSVPWQRSARPLEPRQISAIRLAYELSEFRCGSEPTGPDDSSFPSFLTQIYIQDEKIRFSWPLLSKYTKELAVINQIFSFEHRNWRSRAKAWQTEHVDIFGPALASLALRGRKKRRMLRTKMAVRPSETRRRR